MKKELAGLVLAVVASLVLSAPALARALMVVQAKDSGETIHLFSDKGDCPSGVASDGYKWDARVAKYHDPRDNERQEGCYIIDTRDAEHLVIVIFREGSYAGQPLRIPTRLFKPEV